MGNWLGKDKRREERSLADAIEAHAVAISKLAEALTGTGSNQQVLTAINNLSRKVDMMSSNIDRIEKEAADAAENVGLVKAALDTLNTTVTDLKAVVADLQAQIAQGQIDQARLDAAASTLEKADDDLDALVLPSAPPTPEGGGGEPV